MKKRHLLIALLSVSTIALQAQNIKKIHQKAILIDTHDDVLSRQLKSGVDLSKEQDGYEFDLVKAKRGGLDAQVFSVWGDENIDYAHANREIDSLEALIRRNPSKITLATTAKQVREIVKQGKLAAMIGVEGGHMIDNDLSKIDTLAKRGMIYLTLTWNNSTNWATSAVDEKSGKMLNQKLGLNDFGKQVVRRLNELGVMVDLSHVGEQTFFDAIAVSTKPVILSHSSVYKINPVPRNITDEQLLAVKKNGGVVCVNFFNGFLDPNYDKFAEAFMSKYKDEHSQLVKDGELFPRKVLVERYKDEFEKIKPPIEIIADHIDYIVNLLGIDYVGIGADFDGATSYPQNMDSVADYPNLTKILVKRGYTAKDIEKIYGENFLRILKQNKGE